jgi:hypothetical protein
VDLACVFQPAYRAEHDYRERIAHAVRVAFVGLFCFRHVEVFPDVHFVSRLVKTKSWHKPAQKYSFFRNTPCFSRFPKKRVS